MFRADPSPQIIKTYAWLWVGSYLAIYFFFREIIPEKFLRDALEIQRIIETGFDDVSLSYATPAYIFQFFSLPVLYALVGLINASAIYIILRKVRTMRGMIVMGIILPPLILLGFMSPTKEVFVLLMAAALLYCAHKFSARTTMILAIILAYSVYGLAFRSYYLLILFFFLVYAYMPTHRLNQAIVFLAGFLVLFLVPKDIFFALQGPRDMINMANESGPYEVRTAIYNPFDPESVWGFIGNYIYAFFRLHIPILWEMTANEWVLFVNVVIYAGLLRYSLLFLTGSRRLLALLFLSHITVYILFEPDLGSYFRHFSSVFLYLLPAFSASEERYTARV
jgi:hypothetical protein